MARASHMSKRLKKANDGVDRAKIYPPAEAVKLVKSRASAKFDETVEVAMNLNIDPRKQDQNLRGTVMLPHGTGKTVRVAVFARGDKAKEAETAGADVVGAISRAKPTGIKGTFIKKVSLSSSMGPGLKLELQSIAG